VSVALTTTYFFILLSFALLPFNALPIFGHYLGEASGEGALYPLFVATFIYFSRKWYDVLMNRLYIRKRPLTLFLVCTSLFLLIPFLANLDVILSAFYMNKGGLFRFITQSLLFLICFMSAFMMRDVLSTQKNYLTCLRVLRGTFFLVIFFSFFQYFVYYHSIAKNIYLYVGQFIYEDGVIDYALNVRQGLGLHSVSQEPSFLAMYLAVTFPYVFFTAGSIVNKAFTFLISSVVVYLSWSRTAYIVFMIQCVIALYIMYFKYIRLTTLLALFVPSLLVLYLLFQDTHVGGILASTLNVNESGSSSARLGAAYSALLAWLKHGFFVGVGVGQSGYYLVDYLPDWAFLSNDTWDVFNGLRWPPIHNLWVRVLLETGLLGFFLTISLFLVLFLRINHILTLKHFSNSSPDHLGYASMISLSGVFLIMLNRETITNMNIWLSLGLILSYIRLNTLSRTEC